MRAGQHANFGSAAWAVPFTLGPYVIWTWTDPRAHRGDELAAVALLVASVVLSVAAPPARWQALGIGLVLIVVEWRQVARGRVWLSRRDELAAAAAQVAELQRQVAAAGWKVEELAAALVAAERREPPPVSPQSAAGAAAGGGPAWGRTKETQVEWLRRELAAGRTYTGDQVAELMGLGAPKTGRDRLAAARRPRLVTEEQGEA